MGWNTGLANDSKKLGSGIYKCEKCQTRWQSWKNKMTNRTRKLVDHIKVICWSLILIFVEIYQQYRFECLHVSVYYVGFYYCMFMWSLLINRPSDIWKRCIVMYCNAINLCTENIYECIQIQLRSDLQFFHATAFIIVTIGYGRVRTHLEWVRQVY